MNVFLKSMRLADRNSMENLFPRLQFLNSKNQTDLDKEWKGIPCIGIQDKRNCK